MQDTLNISESDILSEILAVDQGDFPPEAAHAVLRWKFPSRTAKQITQLAQRNQRGTITTLERETLERYLRVGSLINLMQAKARLSLQASHKNGQ